MREQRIVAFIDILGFSNHVKSASENELDLLEKMLEEISQTNNLGSFERTETGCKISPTITTISDSIIISLPIHWNILSGTALEDNKYLTYYNAFDSVYRVISSFIIFFLKRGYLLRGGISCGLIRHDEIIFGKPYIEAVEAEKDFAIVPRVVVCNELLKCLPQSELEKFGTFSLMRIDNDGVFYINWLAHLSFKNVDNNTCLNLIRSNIVEALSKYKNDKKTFAKWCWMANHFNTYVPQYLKAYHKDDSKFSPIEILPF